jgi:hypothetical protein
VFPAPAAKALAAALVAGGLPAVLGWDGSVADSAASAFLPVFYRSLARGDTLLDSVAYARLSMLIDANETRRRDWHLARLWLGSEEGGRIVFGKTRRPDMRPTNYGQTEFLSRKEKKFLSPPMKCSLGGEGNCKRRSARSGTSNIRASSFTEWAGLENRALQPGSSTAGVT